MDQIQNPVETKTAHENRSQEGLGPRFNTINDLTLKPKTNNDNVKHVELRTKLKGTNLPQDLTLKPNTNNVKHVKMRTTSTETKPSH